MATPPRVLVVEDDKNQQLLYKEELEQNGFEVMCAGNGKEAVEMATAKAPDCIVMDISMPEMDGIEAMGKILAQNNRVPVILNTAYASYKDNFMSWSADAYVIKTSDLSQLTSTIKDILAKASAADESAG